MLLYESLAMRLREQIERGTLRAGERLPSIRQLAANHGISAATAVQACLQLEREGRVQARPRAGYFVRATAVASPAAPPAPRRRTPGMVDHPALQRVLDTVARTDLLPLHTATPAPALLPAAHLAAALSRQVRRQRTAALDYAPPQGHAALRRQIAQRYAHCATSVTTDEVVITAGAMEAISLALRTLTMPGDVVLVETPTYHGILQAMAALRLKVLEVPNRSGQGIDIARLESLLQRTKVRAAVLVANFNNPIGSLTPDSAKRALLDSCARHGTVVIEDDIYGELDWSGQRPRPLRHFDTHANVITCGSFSKVLAPGPARGLVARRRLDRRTGARQIFS
ncbi:aspartate aminotransferase [Xanthomonas citri pv. mangiferaeindicae]|nr:aspartate aminotransferase [Xanthomonas citri pv. mangiferaeindicae]